MGGRREEFGPIDRSDHQVEDWERLADAVNVVLNAKGHKTTDEMRRAIESLEGYREMTPDWYKSPAYRSRVVAEPREVLREFGLELPENKRVAVHDSSADLRYLVLPQRPEGTEGMSEGELAALVTRDSLVGTDVPHAAREASRV